MNLDFAPASTLSLEALTDLLNRAFEGYVVPFSLTPAQFNRLLIVDDLSLPHSQIIRIDGEPVGLGGLATRGLVGRVAFFGIVSPWRRHGLGGHLCARLLDVAREIGLSQMVLEVIQSNTPARNLYEQIGFSIARELVFWQTHGDDRPADPTVAAVAPVELLPLTARWPRVPRAWQQATASLSHQLHDLEGHLLAEDGRPLAYALSRRHGRRRHIMDLAAAPDVGDAPALAERLLATLTHDVDELTLANFPSDDPLAPSLPALGFSRSLAQWEMWRAVEADTPG